MRSKAKEVNAVDFAGDLISPRITVLALALSLACSVMGAQAATTSWVSTKTDAFLPHVETMSNIGLAVAADAIATEVTPGELKNITVSLQLRNQEQLDEFLEAVQNPQSPSYHRYLTPEQFAAQYAPTQAQVDTVIAYLTKNGFKNITVSPNRTLVRASGTAGSVKQAFNTSLKSFSHNGRRVFANASAAQVPAELGHIVGSVLGLQNAITHHVMHSGVNTQQPQRGSARNTGTQVPHDPIEFSKIYNAVRTPIASNAVVGTIAAGSVDNTMSDFATFLKNNPSLPQDYVPTVVYVGDKTTDESGEVEWALDSQTIYATGVPKELMFYVASSLEDGPLTETYNKAVTDNKVSAINVSLGICEKYPIASGSQAADDAVFKQAVAQGITFSISSGDAGPYNCAADAMGNPGSPRTTTAKKTYDVSEPASSPYVVAVGGTELFTTASGDFDGQAVWNEGTSQGRLWATGGGFSKNQPAPSYQKASIVGSGHSTRGLPDIAFDAASSSGANIYINEEANGVGMAPIGGTSLSAPIFVGLWARLESAHGNRLGFPNSAFYKAIPSNPKLVFPVTNATINGESVSYNGWSKTYPGMKAGASGWNAATGFGSLNVDAVNDFITANPTVFPTR